MKYDEFALIWSEVKSLSRIQLFATPWTAIVSSARGSLPGSSVHGIFQARILEWVAISFSSIFQAKKKMGGIDETRLERC